MNHIKINGTYGTMQTKLKFYSELQKPQYNTSLTRET